MCMGQRGRQAAAAAVKCVVTVWRHLVGNYSSQWETNGNMLY